VAATSKRDTWNRPRHRENYFMTSQRGYNNQLFITGCLMYVVAALQSLLSPHRYLPLPNEEKKRHRRKRTAYQTIYLASLPCC
jgi:hypothetical protein